MPIDSLPLSSQQVKNFSGYGKAIPVDSDLPSENTKEYFLWAFDTKTKRKVPKNPKPSPVGKWLFYVSNDKVDAAWKSVKEALANGKLGPVAKVSTMFANTYFKDRVVVVYTYDWTDKADVMRVRGELRKLGVTEKIYYKTDERIYGEEERKLAPYFE
jgi:hypothetical protein